VYAKLKVRASNIIFNNEVHCVSVKVEFLFLSESLIILNPRFTIRQEFRIVSRDKVWLFEISVCHVSLPFEFGEAVVVAGDRVVLAPATNYVGHQHSLANAVVDVDAIKV